MLKPRRAIVFAFLVYSSDAVEKMLSGFPNSLQHRRSKKRERLQTKMLGNKHKKKSERRRPTGRIVQHILRPPCAQFIRLQDYTVVKCNVFCDSMNWNAFVTNSTCRKRANRNPGSRPQRCKIINCKQATFHQTCKTCKNCTTPSFSSRLSQENTSPWQPEHFVIDHLCSRAASEQPWALESLHKRWWWYNFLESMENA